MLFVIAFFFLSISAVVVANLKFVSKLFVGVKLIFSALFFFFVFKIDFPAAYFDVFRLFLINSTPAVELLLPNFLNLINK